MDMYEYKTIEAEFHTKLENMNKWAKLANSIPIDKQIMAKVSGAKNPLTAEERHILSEVEKATDELAPALEAYYKMLTGK